MSREELKRGGRSGGPPVAPFTVIAAKTEGVSPGFRMEDSLHRLFFVKVDPPANPEMATAADVIGALFFYALGYNVPENYIVNASPEAFHLSKKASITTASGKKYSMTEEDLHRIIKAVSKTRQGQIRVMASLATSGKIMGPFRYEGVRPDDPNDIIPHQQRRDLRGLEVFCAWLNHTDAKSLNSMDTLQGSGKDAHFRHFLLDFGAAFGSDSDLAKDPRHGREFFMPTEKEQLRQAYTFGLSTPRWERVSYPHRLKAVGNFTSDAFEPKEWHSNYPNPAFLAMLPGDAFWAAKTVMAFRDEDVRAIVEEGQFTDPAVTEYITRTLIERRDKIVRAWLSAELPVDHLRIVDDQLVFDDLVANRSDTSKSFYRIHWFRWNNQTGQEEEAGSSASRRLPSNLSSIAEAGYIGCTLSDASRSELTATAYFRKTATGWLLVGLDRKASLLERNPSVGILGEAVQ